ncbi:alpha/beta fold hydrolase [Saccharopolyspora karakumensis]|uniref:Alpha/beta fold hydrolase n=1 Tax=Saccharopolyspora karakumensis TaxID=2530386 RepID=A0A4V2YY29_9PSEU|nr:alpha/beta fold hydrolase [Saccharopolyspora karakumensis]TDD91557.1 alpha/beta fold hydrolase [Saccharopolyspora karakumensis]
MLVGAEPFAHEGSDDIGVLLCHGFTSTPQSMRGWAEHLAEAGHTVRCPLLPGHGTRWQELNRTTWRDWYGAVEQALDELRDRCRSVFVFGLSMGGTLTLRLAEQNPDIAGIVLVNPSVMTLRKEAKLLPVLSRVVPSLAAIAGDIAKPEVVELAYSRLPLRGMASLQQLWGVVRADLGSVRQPLLLLHSAVDHVVEPENSAIVLNEVGSQDVTEVVLDDSYHVATLDHDAPRIFSDSVEFVHRVHGARVGESA